MRDEQFDPAAGTSPGGLEVSGQFDGTGWLGDRRLEAAARAMARHRLECHSFSSQLTAELIEDLRQTAEERLWPSLIEEARAALDAADQVGKPSQLTSPAAGSVPSDSARFAPSNGQPGA